MYDSHESMPWNQSNDLDFDAARAEWERQGEVRFPTGEELAAMDAAAAREADRLSTAGQQTPTDTPAQIARAAIASYREYVERYGQSPDEATEAAVREVTEGLAVDVAAERAEMAAHPGPTPEEMEGWPL